MTIQPISNFLPRSYAAQSPVQYLFKYPDETVLAYEDRLTLFVAQYFTIETATNNGLDFMAQLNGLTVFFWQKSWAIEVKRTLILNYQKLITERGNKDLVQWLFNVFGYRALLVELSGWILDTTALPAPLSNSNFDYQIKVDTAYIPGSPERTTIDLIIRQFVPKFIDIAIVYY